ncbi:MAG: alpha/beta hydrolase [Candidatus Binatia bacterium]
MARLGRYENPYLTVEFHRDPPVGSTSQVVGLRSADRANSHGVLWLPPGARPRTVLTLMHPRADFHRHYVVPPLLDAGYAVFTQNSRWVGNDSMLIHETVLFDVAAGMQRLRDLGFENVIPVGNSGGGSLYTYYVSQAHAAPNARICETPAGDPAPLAKLSMPPVDAMVYLAAHPGEGLFLLEAIDPSVVDENDPVACDTRIDMYDPGNGFHAAPEATRYDRDFLARYRTAQHERIERIDAHARALVARRRDARRRAMEHPHEATPWREAIAVQFLRIYRTEADPRYVDLSLDPSDRDYGSLWTHRPDLFNYGPFGFSRMVTPEAWLSTWSGLSSNASIPARGPGVNVPAIVVGYTGDNGVFREDARLIFDSLGSGDKRLVEVAGDHYGFPLVDGDEWGRDRAVRTIVEWLGEKGF